MNENIVSLLIQVPVLGVFIWWSLKTQNAFTAALDKRDELYERRNSALVAALTQTTCQMTALTEMIVRLDARCFDEPLVESASSPRKTQPRKPA